MYKRAFSVFCFFSNKVAGKLSPCLFSLMLVVLTDASVQANHCKDWTFELSTPGWVPWVEGQQTVVGQSVDVQSDPFRIIDHLYKMPVMGDFEARNEQYGFYADVLYGGESYKQSALKTTRGATISEALGLKTQTTVAEFGLVFVLGKWRDRCKSTALDLLIGARYWHVDASLKLDLTEEVSVPGIRLEREYAVAEELGVHWVDPMIGVRIRRDLGNGKKWRLRGDVAGFGAGSDFTWNLETTYEFPVCKSRFQNLHQVIGYRLLDVDYSTENTSARFDFDYFLHGPILGLSMTF